MSQQMLPHDLAAVLARKTSMPELAAAASPEEIQPAYQPPPPPVKPWSERHLGLLYGTLAVAILGMGHVIVRCLASVKRPSPERG